MTSAVSAFPKKALATGLAAFAVLTGAAAANAGEAHAGTVHNVRSGPSLSAPVVGTIYNANCSNVHSLAINPNGHGAWNATVASNGNHGYIFNDGWCI